MAKRKTAARTNVQTICSARLLNMLQIEMLEVLPSIQVEHAYFSQPTKVEKQQTQASNISTCTSKEIARHLVKVQRIAKRACRLMMRSINLVTARKQTRRTTKRVNIK